MSLNYEDVPLFIRTVWEWVDSESPQGVYGIHGDAKPVDPQDTAKYEMRFSGNDGRWGLIAEMVNGSYRVEAFDGWIWDSSSLAFREFHGSLNVAMGQVARWVVQGLE